MKRKLTMKKIVLVDDINFQLLAIAERLKDKYEVYTARSAEEMYGVFEKVMPDLIILDINMPDTDGFEIITKLKANKSFSKIPVIFLTSRRDKSSALKGLSLGAVDYMTKPYSIPALIDCIESHLNPKNREAEKAIILAVDDSPVVLQMIDHALQDYYTVYTLPEPAIVNEVLKKVVPDLFILDYQMPQLTGFDLIPIIRNHPLHKETPIALLTSEATVDNLTIAINLGFCGFLVKPIDETLLREKVSDYLSDFMMRRRVRVLDDI